MAAVWIGRGWVEPSLIGQVGAAGLGESVIDFEDDAFGAVVVIEAFFIPLFHDGKRVHDVGHGVARRGERFGERFVLLSPLEFRAEI